jgi:hypothetical protein
MRTRLEDSDGYDSCYLFSDFFTSKKGEFDFQIFTDTLPVSPGPKTGACVAHAGKSSVSVRKESPQ